KLVDAAHIVPVSDPRSSDDVTNGLALCRLHHGAYDNALLGVKSDYTVIINPHAERRLQEIRLDHGLLAFKQALPVQIRLPASREARPSTANLRIGLEVRGWPSDL